MDHVLRPITMVDSIVRCYDDDHDDNDDDDEDESEKITQYMCLLVTIVWFI